MESDLLWNRTSSEPEFFSLVKVFPAGYELTSLTVCEELLRRYICMYVCVFYIHMHEYGNVVSTLCTISKIK